MTKTESVLFLPEFPRSNTYDPDWVMQNQMGPNALWLMEWLCVPGLMRGFEKGVPGHLTRAQSNGAAFWEEGCVSFMTLERWRELWENSSRVDVKVADTLAEGWRYWRDFELALEQTSKSLFPSVVEALNADQGRYIGFIRLIALRKPGPPGANIYDPALITAMEKAGVLKPRGS
jgi:hypothetical protein